MNGKEHGKGRLILNGDQVTEGVWFDGDLKN